MWKTSSQFLGRLVSEYGMLVVLGLLCSVLSAVTYSEHHPVGAAAGRQMAADIRSRFGDQARVLVIIRETRDDVTLAESLQTQLRAEGPAAITVIQGSPQDARRELQRVAKDDRPWDAIACHPEVARWGPVRDRAQFAPRLAQVEIVSPRSYHWPVFLTADNLLNVANQIAVIAILAIGMTFVIITGGIDLSVGSLIALSAVVTTLLIRDVAGSYDATVFGLTWSSLAGMAVCGGVGLLSGLVITRFRIPPFIVTLATMLIASGAAADLTGNQSVYQIPGEFVWLGGGRDVLHIPNSVILMLALYLLAHLLMSRTILGRHLYAVGGNAEAARLSGIRVQRVQLFAYTMSGLLAGLGGVVLASQLKSGSATFGKEYELKTIAAVVVGGTSLAGGEGKVFGSLIGAFIIAVMENGLNLTNVAPEKQRIVLGGVILFAVLFDQWRQRWWTRRGLSSVTHH